MKRTVGLVAVAAAVAAGVLVATRWSSSTGDRSARDSGPVAFLAPDAAYPQAFSLVSTVRELPDGRVLVADPLGQALVRVDLARGLADTLGRVGDGPDEYRQPDAVWPLPGERTLLVDLGNGRLTELSPDLEFGATRPYAVGEVGPGRDLVLAIPAAVDAEGRLYFRGLGRMGSGATADSGSVLRFDPRDEAVDTVAKVKLPGTVSATTGGPGNESVRVSEIPLSPADAWGVAADGRVAVARSDGYRLEWIEPDGSVTRGPEIAYEAVSIGRAEMEQWRHARSETGGGLGISLTIVNDAMTVTAARAGASRDDGLDDYEWPDAKPAFQGPILVDGRGRAWVRRHGAAGDAPKYDLFGPEGTRDAIVELGAERRVVAFGDRSVYVVRMDEYGLQYLERHAMP